MANKITLSISKELKQKSEEKIKETNFKSIREYILFMLDQMIFKNRENIGKIRLDR